MTLYDYYTVLASTFSDNRESKVRLEAVDMAN
jgi:hypothetical protein